MTRDEKIEFYKEKLTLVDETEILEILDLTAEDIVLRFGDCIDERLEYIESYYDENDSIDAMMRIIDGGSL